MKSATTATGSSPDLFITKPGHMGIINQPLRPLEAGEFLVHTLYSGVSAGTELTFFAGTNPKAHELFDPHYRFFRPVKDGEARSNEYPVMQDGLEVGRVAQSRSAKVPEGSLVAMVYGHKTAHIAHEDAYYIVLPDDFDPLLGIFVAKMGPICANGILYAANDLQRQKLVTLRGGLARQRVVVYGAGVVGLLTASLAKWAGAEEVIIVDGIDERLQVAAAMGLVPMKAAPELPTVLKDRWARDNGVDTGADFVFQCTGSDELLAQAFKVLREQGTVVDLGFYQTGAGNVFLGREFHHNNLRHLCAQIGTMPRHQQPRWDRRALAMETIQFLGEYGARLKEHAITHVVPFSQAQGIYDAMLRRDPGIGIVVLRPDVEAAA